MGLFDAIREKAGELMSGATEQVGDMAGNLPGAQEVQDLSQSATDVAGQASEQVTGAAQDFGDTATGAVEDVTEPYRP